MNSYSAYNFGITKESLKDVQFYKNYLKSSVQSINDYNNHLVVKTVIIGSQGVGKTSVVNRYINSSFTKSVRPTIGASFMSCTIRVKQKGSSESPGNVTLHVWDSAGQERFRSMMPMYYRNCEAAIIVFDITSISSFLDMKNWTHELKNALDSPIMITIVGNKADLYNDREVTRSDGERYAEAVGGHYYETSAFSGQGIEDVFQSVADRMFKSDFQDSFSLRVEEKMRLTYACNGYHSSVNEWGDTQSSCPC